MFWRKKEKRDYDRENLVPMIRVSICTGEQTAGFRNKHTGKFSDVMLIRDNSDLAEFLETYGISPEELTTGY